MQQDDFTFPEPAGFDDQTPGTRRTTVTPGRLVGLFALIAAVALAAGLVEYGGGLFEKFGLKLPAPNARNPEFRIIQRIRDHYHAGQIDDALRECDALIQLHPKEGYQLKVFLLNTAGRYKETLDIFGKILAIDPFDASAYNGRAYNRALCRIELNEAQRDIAKALEIRGDEPAFIDTRGYLHYLLGRHQEALMDFNSVLRDDDRALRGLDQTGLGEVYFHRGLVYQQLGKKDLAEKDFARARKQGFEIKDYPPPLSQEEQKQLKG